MLKYFGFVFNIDTKEINFIQTANYGSIQIL